MDRQRLGARTDRTALSTADVSRLAADRERWRGGLNFTAARVAPSGYRGGERKQKKARRETINTFRFRAQ